MRQRQELDKLRRQHRPVKGDKTKINMNISNALLEQVKERASLDDRTTTSFIARAVKHYLECNKLSDIHVHGTVVDK